MGSKADSIPDGIADSVIDSIVDVVVDSAAVIDAARELPTQRRGGPVQRSAEQCGEVRPSRRVQRVQRPRDHCTHAPPAFGLMEWLKRFFQSPCASRRRPRALSAGSK